MNKLEQFLINVLEIKKDKYFKKSIMILTLKLSEILRHELPCACRVQVSRKAEDSPCPFSVLACVSRRKMFWPACVHTAQKACNQLNPCKKILTSSRQSSRDGLYRFSFTWGRFARTIDYEFVKKVQGITIQLWVGNVV